MNEYYCPNCNAILNHQFGFDPCDGTWTCTECGQYLMDEDIYEGELFEGVAWRCDNCDALLNRQYGFSDSFGTWICTDCGHINGITSDDIIVDHDILRCPNCNGVLNNQFGFSEYSNDWECLSCGAKLHRDYSYNEYSMVEEECIECPNCFANLREQSCFSDYINEWKCTNCGMHLHRNYSDEQFENAEEEFECPNCGTFLNEQPYYSSDEDDWVCTECGAVLHRENYFEPYDIVFENNVEYNKQKSHYSRTTTNIPSYDSKPEESISIENPHTNAQQKFSSKELRKQRIKAFFFNQKKIYMNYDFSDLLGKDIAYVEMMLYNQAFNNVKLIPIKDIYVDSAYRVGQVEQVVINGSSYFRVGDWIPYDAEIVVTYHVKRLITIPYSNKSLQKLNYISVIDKLKKLGFTEIYKKPIYDLIVGWIIKDGDIERITIGDMCPFKKNNVFAYDARIVIEYHTFKQK